MFINMSNVSHEIVHEGWLTKSPPSKRIWKARWRRRWFVLRHSGELPGQFFLQYYTDKNCRKLKGIIDLDQCEQVDAGLTFKNSKHNYNHLFDVKTPKRTYYLAAESESDMNRWVDCVCQVCGLKATHDDTSTEVVEESSESPLSPCCGDTESPPTSPASSVSGPYIPISECISGKPLNTPLGISDFNNIVSRQALSAGCDTRHSQLRVNKLNNIQQTICADDISKSDYNKAVTVMVVDRLSSLYSERNMITNVIPKDEPVKMTNIESAKKMAEARGQGRRPPDLKLVEPVTQDFYDLPRKIVMDTSPRDVPPPNWETFPESSEEADFSPGDIGSWSVVNRFGKLQVVDSKLPIVTNSLNRRREARLQLETSSLRRPVAPPRPPKPQYLVISENTHNYLNLENKEETPPPGNDDTYDFPRSHQPSSTPKDEVPTVGGRHTYSNAAPGEGNVFRYDFDTNHVGGAIDPASPRWSEGSGCGVAYSNLPSPLITGQGVPTPPIVNRELKPSRKMSDSGQSSEPSPGPYTPSLSMEPSPGGPFCQSGGSAEPSPGALSNQGPPNIDRTLKPKKVSTEGALKLGKPPDSSLSLRRGRAGPGPTPRQVSATLPSSSRSKVVKDLTETDDPRLSPDHEPIYFFESMSRYLPVSKRQPDIQYLDLDLDSEVGNVTPVPTSTPSETRHTVYKTVDFLKTEAFNRTKKEVEEEWRKKGTTT